MRTGRPKATLKLNEDEKRELTSLAHRSRSAPALARRARIVLVCAEGHDNHTVARKLRVTPRTVGKWRNRFLQDRLEGLYDEPRGAFQRAHHHLLDSFIGNRAGRTRPRLIVQALQSVLQKAVAPLADCPRRDAQLTRHRVVVVSLGANQYDARAARQRRCRARSVSERCQFAFLVLIQFQSGLGSSCAHAPSL